LLLASVPELDLDSVTALVQDLVLDESVPALVQDLVKEWVVLALVEEWLLE
jgi:hypothetical protein